MDSTQSPDSQNVTTTDTSMSFEPQKAIGKGFCFDCDKPVQVEYDKWWLGNYEPPKTCQECGGHDVEFMGRVAERIWDKLGIVSRSTRVETVSGTARQWR